MTNDAVHRAIDAVWRIESARVIASLMRLTGDLAVAEDLAQDALVAALEQWPDAGIPDNPGAWLTAAAKHRAIDHHRRAQRLERKHAEIGALADEATPAVEDQLVQTLDDPVRDDLLRLVFIACHPVLGTDAQVALTLRVLGGLTTDEIARAFLVPVPTMAQRIVRAKRTLSDAHVPFEVPRGEELTARVASVLKVVYLIFNEGYAATAGEDWVRPELCQDALRLGRIVAGLASDQAEVHGLVALMELHAARMRARTGPAGEAVLLFEQDRGRWDRAAIQRGLAALKRAQADGPPFGPYTLQAAIVACHARARTADETDWIRIAALYEALARTAPSPVIDVNRAIAHGMAFTPERGLAMLDALADERTLENYHLLPAARGEMLSRLSRHDEARAEFARAATLARNERERAVLSRRAERVGIVEDAAVTTDPAD